jgi:hypothetical protein
MGRGADVVGDGEFFMRLDREIIFDAGAVAQIHDFCAYHGIHHFVLTTYEKWIFGLFTESESASKIITKHQPSHAVVYL